VAGITYAIQSECFRNMLWHKSEWRDLVPKGTLEGCCEGIERILAPFAGDRTREPSEYRAVKLNAKGKILAIYAAEDLLAGKLVESHLYQASDLVAA